MTAVAKIYCIQFIFFLILITIWVLLGRFAWTEAPAQVGCAHAGEAVWTLADGRRTSSGAGKQLGARIFLGGGQFLGALKRVEIDCSVGSNTLAAAPQPALCIPDGMLPPVSKRRSGSPNVTTVGLWLAPCLLDAHSGASKCQFVSIQCTFSLVSCHTIEVWYYRYVALTFWSQCVRTWRLGIRFQSIQARKACSTCTTLAVLTFNWHFIHLCL